MKLWERISNSKKRIAIASLLLVAIAAATPFVTKEKSSVTEVAASRGGESLETAQAAPEIKNASEKKAPLPAPKITSGTGLIDRGLPRRIRWKKVAGARSYQIQILKPDLANPLVVTETELSTRLIADTPGTWQISVRAVDEFNQLGEEAKTILPVAKPSKRNIASTTEATSSVVKNSEQTVVIQQSSETSPAPTATPIATPAAMPIVATTPAPTPVPTPAPVTVKEVAPSPEPEPPPALRPNPPAPAVEKLEPIAPPAAIAAQPPIDPKANGLGFWFWIGTGVSYSMLSQDVVDVQKVEVGGFSVPSFMGHAGFWATENFGLDLTYKDTPGEISGSPGIEVQNGKLHWRTMAVELLVRPAPMQDQVNSFSGRFGFQVHQIPFAAAISNSAIVVNEHTIASGSVGFEYRRRLLKNLRFEWMMHYQFPFATTAEVGSTYSVKSKFTFDGSVGAAYQLTSNVYLGAYWYGQSHSYTFDYKDSFIPEGYSGKHNLFHSTMDVRLGVEF